jgi:hypothetical protein
MICDITRRRRIFHRAQCPQLACCLHLSSPGVKHRLGVTVFRLSSFEYQIQRRLKRDALFPEVWSHIAIVAIAFVLPVNDFRHSFESLPHLFLGDDAMM